MTWRLVIPVASQEPSPLPPLHEAWVRALETYFETCPGKEVAEDVHAISHKTLGKQRQVPERVKKSFSGPLAPTARVWSTDRAPTKLYALRYATTESKREAMH